MPWPVSALPYPFELGFMQRALVASLAVGIFAPMIGTFLVQKRMSLIGDGIGHVAFAGVGAGVDRRGLAGVDRARVRGGWGAGRGVASRRGAGRRATWPWPSSSTRGSPLGVVLVSLGGGLNASLLTYLFGQPLTVNDSEVWS